MRHASKQLLRLGILAAGVLTLMGCQTIRDATGLSKSGPDEFAVVTKAPLIVPPEFNLRPPKDGAPPTNQVEPTQAAQSALFDAQDSSGAAAVGGDYSEAEKLLLASAGATNPDPSIRQQIASDGRSMEAANDSFTKDVLFWQEPQDQGVNVDADSEARRLDAQKNGGQVAPKKADNPATIEKKEDKGGWFDWF
ncbi:MAG TPA: DUF3035 domain-containing protein [Rhizomicrobium sp.]|jgi:hypothetical protein|nr:DUF3035 domain-containing protein [Rhizomicrobium sp.]